MFHLLLRGACYLLYLFLEVWLWCVLVEGDDLEVSEEILNKLSDLVDGNIRHFKVVRSSTRGQKKRDKLEEVTRLAAESSARVAPQPSQAPSRAPSRAQHHAAAPRAAVQRSGSSVSKSAAARTRSLTRRTKSKLQTVRTMQQEFMATAAATLRMPGSGGGAAAPSAPASAAASFYGGHARSADLWSTTPASPFMGEGGEEAAEAEAELLPGTSRSACEDEERDDILPSLYECRQPYGHASPASEVGGMHGRPTLRSMASGMWRPVWKHAVKPVYKRLAPVEDGQSTVEARGLRGRRSKFEKYYGIFDQSFRGAGFLTAFWTVHMTEYYVRKWVLFLSCSVFLFSVLIVPNIF